MLSQKLSRITLKMTDLKEYEDIKKRKKEAEKSKRENEDGSGLTITSRKTPRKALTFDTATPARASTPNQ